MRPSWTALLSSAAMGAAAAVIASHLASAQDSVATNPGKYRTVFENDRVRLLEFQDKPGAITVMHHHPARLVYSLAPWKKKFRYPDGRTEVLQGKAGDAAWAEPGSHAGENIGETETHVLIFELKEPAK